MILDRTLGPAPPQKIARSPEIEAAPAGAKDTLNHPDRNETYNMSWCKSHQGGLPRVEAGATSGRTNFVIATGIRGPGAEISNILETVGNTPVSESIIWRRKA